MTSSTHRLLALGGNGYTAQRVIKIARSHGWHGSVASREEPVEADSWFAWDAMGECTFQEALGPDTSVLYSVPTMFRDVPPDDGHLEPVRRVLSACETYGCDRFIYLSSTAVYGNHHGEWVDESSERNPTSPFGVMRRDIEDVVLDQGGYVVRIVGIYGPGRTLVEAFERGRYRLVDGGSKVSNRIHVDDLANVVWQVIAQQPDDQVFIAADGHPLPVRDIVDWLKEYVGIEPPESVSLQTYEAERGKNNADRWRNQIRCKNDRLREILGVELVYPDVLAGYRAIFEASEKI